MNKKIKILLYFTLFIFLIWIILKVEQREESVQIKEIKPIASIKEHNQTRTLKRVNQKPTLNAGADQNISFGEEVTLEAIAKDRDGEIVSYLWREGNETLSEKESLDCKFDKGVHHLKVTVLDNDGAEAEDNVTVNVGFWVLDRIVVNNKNPVCGTFDGEIKYAYNSDGKIIKAMLDSNRDAVVNEVYYYGYDEEGRDVFEALDFDNDGVIDRNRSKSFYTNGKIKESCFSQYGKDGRRFSINKKEYTEDGRVVKETTNSSVREYHYNENNQLVEIIGIENGEIHIDKEYHYNENNQLLEVISMENGEPKIDEKYHYRDGLLVEKELYYWESYVRKEYYTYEGEELKKKKKVNYNDGNIGSTTINHYNEKGQMVEEIYNDKHTHYTYDDEYGRLAIEESAKKKEHYFYDSQGHKIRDEIYTKSEDGEFKQQCYTIYAKDEDETVFLNRNTTIIHNNFDSKRQIHGSIIVNQKREVYDEYGNLIEIWDDLENKLVQKMYYRFVIPRF